MGVFHVRGLAPWTFSGVTAARDGATSICAVRQPAARRTIEQRTRVCFMRRKCYRRTVFGVRFSAFGIRRKDRAPNTEYRTPIPNTEYRVPAWPTHRELVLQSRRILVTRRIET